MKWIVFAVGLWTAAAGQGIRETVIVSIPGIISANAKWTLAWQGTDNADGLIGTADGGLLFAQEQPNRVSKLDSADKISIFLEDTHGTGALAIDANGRIIAVQRTCTDPGGKGAACTEPTMIGTLSPQRKTLADSFNGKPLGRLNDLVVDKRGGAYFTVGGVFYMSPAGQVSSLGQNLRTNGVMLSTDEKTLYVTNGGSIVAFDIQTDGSVQNQRDFAKLEGGGNGDGMAIDASGRLYVTTGPGVQIISPEGHYLGLIPSPRPVISAAFSGPNKKMLYVVGSGAFAPDGKEFRTPEGVRNNAKSIYKIQLDAQGFTGRAK